MSNDTTFSPDKTYVIVGSKIMDDGTIQHIARCSGKQVIGTLNDHFKDEPSSDSVEVLELVGAYRPKITAEKVQ